MRIPGTLLLLLAAAGVLSLGMSIFKSRDSAEAGRCDGGGELDYRGHRTMKRQTTCSPRKLKSATLNT
jgi:hypothetical protein